MAEEKETLVDRFKRIERILEDINTMLLRWRTGRIITHLDIDLFERTVHDRVDLERHLMVAMETIQVLSNQINKNEIILKHFNEDDRKYMRRRIQARLDREERERNPDTIQEVPEVHNN